MTNYDASQITKLDMPPTTLDLLLQKPPTEWVQDDWYYAVMVADEGGEAGRRIMAKLREAYPEGGPIRTVLEFAEHDAWFRGQVQAALDNPDPVRLSELPYSDASRW